MGEQVADVLEEVLHGGIGYMSGVEGERLIVDDHRQCVGPCGPVGDLSACGKLWWCGHCSQTGCAAHWRVKTQACIAGKQLDTTRRRQEA